MYGKDINVLTILHQAENEELSTKVSSLGIFTLKAFLNLGMLLTESEKTKQLRALILYVVIHVLNKKMGEII